MAISKHAMIWGIIIVIILILIGVTLQRRLGSTEVLSIDDIQALQGVPVDIIRAPVLDVSDWRTFFGVAEGAEQIDVEVDYRSRVKRVHVALGDAVESGDIIVSLDAYDPARAANNLQSAKTRYESARKDSIRMGNLFSKGAIAEQQLDQIMAATESARAAYLTARRAICLDTPITGVVTALHVDEGEYADAGQVVATVSSFDTIRVPFTVSGEERRAIAKGQPVRLHIDRVDAIANDRPPGKDTSRGSSAGDALEHGANFLHGTIRRAAFSADSQTRLFTVEAEIQNKARIILPGSLIRFDVLIGTDENVPVVPSVSMARQNGDFHLFVVTSAGDSLIARKRPVHPGIQHLNRTAIERGIEPGDSVIVSGQNRVDDGVKVRLHGDVTHRYFTID